MLDMVFIFDSKKYGSIFLNGPYNAEPKKILKMYIDWYHTDYGQFEDDTDDRGCEDFIFREFRCPIDFYEDYINLYKVGKKKYDFERKQNDTSKSI